MKFLACAADIKTGFGCLWGRLEIFGYISRSVFIQCGFRVTVLSCGKVFRDLEHCFPCFKNASLFNLLCLTKRQTILICLSINLTTDDFTRQNSKAEPLYKKSQPAMS